jgi:asparagine synthase (glutamine-hydrolysing)
MKLKHLEAKHLLRVLAGRRLPPQLLSIPKHGFTAPVARWITENEPTLRNDVLGGQSLIAEFVDVPLARRWLTDHVAGRADHSYALWALWMLQKWRVNCGVGRQAAGGAGDEGATEWSRDGLRAYSAGL